MDAPLKIIFTALTPEGTDVVVVVVVLLLLVAFAAAVLRSEVLGAKHPESKPERESVSPMGASRSIRRVCVCKSIDFNI